MVRGGTVSLSALARLVSLASAIVTRVPHSMQLSSESHRPRRTTENGGNPRADEPAMAVHQWPSATKTLCEVTTRKRKPLHSLPSHVVLYIEA